MRSPWWDEELDDGTYPDGVPYDIRDIWDEQEERWLLAIAYAD